MAAWLVTEDPQTLIRLDSIVSLAAVPVNDTNDPKWANKHPGSRIVEARQAQIMVGTLAGQMVCALTCPGAEAQAVRDQLMTVIVEQSGKSKTVYVYGPQREWPRDAFVWSVGDEIPEPDFKAIA